MVRCPAGTARGGKELGEECFFPRPVCLDAAQSQDPLSFGSAVWGGLSNPCGFAVRVLHVCVTDPLGVHSAVSQCEGEGFFW